MFRIDHETAVAVKPAPAAAGDPGFFTKGNPIGGIPATVVTDDWANSIQEELVSILTAAGITPDKAATDQVLAAIQSLNGALFPLRGIQVYSTAGAHTWNVPEGVSKAYVTVVGGGGAGSKSTSASVRSPGGGAGGAAIGLVDLAGATSVPVTVGVGGAATGGGVSGGSGGTSSFGAFMSAAGGSGGNYDTGAGGAGGLGTGGQINVRGGSGSDASPDGSANGGNSMFGGGGRSHSSVSSAVLTTGAGSGGTSSGAPSPVNGAPGIVVIQW